MTNTEEKKKKTMNKFIKFFLIFLLFIGISALLVGVGLLWQQKFDLLAFCDSFYFSAIILFSFGFFVFAANHNAFSALVYGTKSFFNIMIGKRHKMTYYEYTEKIKENPIPKYFMIYPLIASIPNFIVAIVLHVIFNKHYYEALL